MFYIPARLITDGIPLYLGDIISFSSISSVPNNVCLPLHLRLCKMAASSVLISLYTFWNAFWDGFNRQGISVITNLLIIKSKFQVCLKFLNEYHFPVTFRVKWTQNHKKFLYALKLHSSSYTLLLATPFFFRGRFRVQLYGDVKWHAPVKQISIKLKTILKIKHTEYKIESLINFLGALMYVLSYTFNNSWTIIIRRSIGISFHSLTNNQFIVYMLAQVLYHFHKSLCFHESN